MNDTKDILLKAWELTQAIAKNNAETAWKVRMWGITIWSGLISYGFNTSSTFMMIISIAILVPIFIFECGIRVIEYKMINRSHEIENSINKILTNSEIEIPEDGIKINITETSISDFKRILVKKRWLIWAPYIALILTSLLSILSIR